MRRFMFVLIFSFLILGVLFADRRPFVWTYIYSPGHVEVIEAENYLTFDTKSLSDITNTSFDYQFEVETGLGGGWDFAMYNVFKQSSTGSLRYDSSKFRFRYAIFGGDGYLFDAQLYMEYKLFSSLSKHGFEFKFIVSKELGSFVFGFNPVYEISVDYYTTPKHEFKVIGGSSFALNESIFLGFESEIKYEVKDSNYVNVFSLGPTVSIGSSEIWLNIGILFNLTKEAMKSRILLSFYL